MVITVQCPSCATTFPVDPKKVPVGGVNARCSACSGIFRVVRPEEVMAASPPAAPPSTPPAPPPPSAPPEVPRVETAVEHAGSHAGPDAPKPADMDLPSAQPEAVDDWVFETEPDLDPAAFDIQPMEEATEEVELEVVEPEMETFLAPVEPPAPPPPPAPTLEAPQPAGAFTFGKRDPADKARRLARVLVSDMIMYNPERHERALAKGTLKEDFADEITKSWKEYVEQVGADMARGNSFWTEALNDVLAKGERVF